MDGGQHGLQQYCCMIPVYVFAFFGKTELMHLCVRGLLRSRRHTLQQCTSKPVQQKSSPKCETWVEIEMEVEMEIAAELEIDH